MSSKKTITALALAGSLFCGHAFAVNITLSDPNATGETSSGWYKGTQGGYVNGNATNTRITSEYEEVEPGMQTGKRWDLIAFTADHSNANNKKLGILGTFDLLNGATGNGNGVPTPANPMFVGGDVFISTNPAQIVNYTDGQNFGPTSNNNGAPGRYDFALRMNFTTNTYDIYQLSSTTVFENTYYDAQNYNAPSNPWKLASVVNNGLTYLGSRSLNYTATMSNASASAQAQFSVTSGGNNTVGAREKLNYVELNNMEWLSPYLNATSPVSYFHYTMECGNDNLIGLDSTGFTRVPEQASTLALVGLALLGLPAVRSFRRR